MFAHKMIVGENSNFAVEYNLPKELRGLPLEVIIFPISEKQSITHDAINEITNLLSFNDQHHITIPKDISIANLANEVNL